MNQKEILPVLAAAFFIYLITRPKTASASNGSSPNPSTYPSTVPNVPALPPGTAPGVNAPGSAGESYLGISNLPRGLRNNNPGNFKMSAANWQGKVPQADNTDGTFQQYYFFPMGVRMMIKELKNNYINAGYDTITTLLNRYDPPGNTNYINYVSQQMGIGVNKPLVADKETLRKLVKAIARFENGYTGIAEAVNDVTFDYAYTLI